MTLVATAAAAAALLAASPLADTAHDELLRRTPVPSADRRQGEVRIVRRGQTVVVQTVLHSKVLRRVAGEIAQKEARGWPPGAEGSAESARYVEALRDVVDAIRRGESRSSDGGGDRFREMRIEFFVHAGEGTVVLSGAEVAEEADGLRLTAVRKPVEVLELSADYVGRNMVRIVEDSFGVTAEQARRLLTAPN